ncbi:ABC transporter permease [Actinomadura barringtoniae]|uniref:ABC transporter permease n=1 Tax=Actinomadura barringtoniae TaxID=1427535 RepID=A0A939PMT3_9ACTN|nr:ABC transporter permease [Actinomadura barringtoniae]MBO2452014.1 ABC transporter permease [Actinomadura barringtoniae]
MRNAIASEWTKIWSLRSTWWTLLAALGLMGLMSAVLATSTAANNDSGDPALHQGVVQDSDMAIGAIDLVQFVLITLAILMITSEYATGSIRTTLQWVPVRARMLAAKATVATAVILPAGLILGTIGTAVSDPLLAHWGRFSPAQATADVAAIGVYLALISVFILSVGAMLRSTAGTLTTAFLFLMALPMLLANSKMGLLKHIADALPSTAGRHFMSGDATPYPPTIGLLIMVGWATAAAALATYLLRHRDA